MSNERVIFAHEMGDDQGFRILVHGAVDAALAGAIKAFAEFQFKLVSPGPAAPVTPPAEEKAE